MLEHRPHLINSKWPSNIRYFYSSFVCQNFEVGLYCSFSSTFVSLSRIVAKPIVMYICGNNLFCIILLHHRLIRTEDKEGRISKQAMTDRQKKGQCLQVIFLQHGKKIIAGNILGEHFFLVFSHLHSHISLTIGHMRYFWLKSTATWGGAVLPNMYQIAGCLAPWRDNYVPQNYKLQK